MAAEKSPTFVLPIKLKITPREAKMIESELEINRVIYNTCLGELLKRERSMKQTKRFKKCMREYKAISVKLALAKKATDKKALLSLKNEKKQLSKKFGDLRTQFGVSEYSIHAFMSPIRKHFGNRVNSAVAQKTATRAWNAFEKKMYGKAKTVHFVRKGEMNSFEGKSNATGWRYKNRQIEVNGQSFGLIIQPKDIYLLEALHLIDNEQTFDYKNSSGESKIVSYRVKYVQIVRKYIRNQNTYYAHLVCAGYPPTKKDKNGKMRHAIGKGSVGLDIGTSSLAVASETAVFLKNLGEDIKRIDEAERNIKLLARAMDRSKRAMNPNNYNENGTVRNGKKTWTFSNRYKKLRDKHRSLHRRLAVLRKLSHQRMANGLLALGDEFYIEEMNFRSLQKRAKKTEISEKTRKHKKKKRFGKTIAHRAPALFVNTLAGKVKSCGGNFTKVDTWSFKASQYDHTTDECVKKELKERWHCFSDGTKVQRDLYSAFLLMNANPNGKNTNRALCENTYQMFKQQHDVEIERLEQLQVVTLNSGIRLKEKKEALRASW